MTPGRDRTRLPGVAFLLLLSLPPAGAAASASSSPQALPVPAIISPEAAEILERVLDGEPLQELELRSRPYFFPLFQGGTLCVVGFRVGRDGLLFGARDEAGVDHDGMPVEVAVLELFGALLQDGVEVKRLGTGFMLPRSAVGDDLSSPYSFAESLPAGRYELVWGVRDTISSRASVRRDTLDVPALGAGELALSTVIVSSDFRPAAGGANSGTGGNTVSAGVRVFTATFEDDLERTFDRQVTPEVSLTFIVAGARPDPATQAFNLEISYRVLDGLDRSVLRLPTQGSARTTISQPVPIALAEALEGGHPYRFEITVRDLVAGTQVIEHVPFHVVR